MDDDGIGNFIYRYRGSNKEKEKDRLPPNKSMVTWYWMRTPSHRCGRFCTFSGQRSSQKLDMAEIRPGIFRAGSNYITSAIVMKPAVVPQAGNWNFYDIYQLKTSKINQRTCRRSTTQLHGIIWFTQEKAGTILITNKTAKKESLEISFSITQIWLPVFASTTKHNISQA